MGFYQVNNLRSFTKVENSRSSRDNKKVEFKTVINFGKQAICLQNNFRTTFNQQVFEQEATVTLAPARLSKSIGTVASISSNPLASKTKTEFSTTEIKNESLNLTFLSEAD